MKIGMIAVSGVRAASEELNRIGLTLPGFVERSKVIASLPSLSLLTLAALTPSDIEIEYHEIRDLPNEPHRLGDFDLVAISSFSAQMRDAYHLADRYEAQGVPVVLGGLHVTMLPDEARQHCSCVAVGEGELLWPRIIKDFQAGRLQPMYAPPAGVTFDLADAPLPRYDLLDFDRYNRLTVQTSRGCPYRCDFCASSILLTPKYRVKPVDRVLAEVRQIKSMWKRPFIEFADDNSFVDRRQAKALLAELAKEKIKWFSEVDVSIADDLELLDLMRASGCRQVLIGLESPTPAALTGVEMKRNFKHQRRPDYEKAIHTIQSRGISVNGCFVLGLDGDTMDVFEDIYNFVDRTGLYDVQLTVLTPFPGTPLYERLLREDRIIDEGAWEKCTLFDVNFVPRNMTPEQLQQGLVDLGSRMYDPVFRQARHNRFIEEVYRHGTPTNLADEADA